MMSLGMKLIIYKNKNRVSTKKNIRKIENLENIQCYVI